MIVLHMGAPSSHSHMGSQGEATLEIPVSTHKKTYASARPEGCAAMGALPVVGVLFLVSCHKEAARTFFSHHAPQDQTVTLHN